MGFMLGDPFNYSPVRKLAESFRVETGVLGVGEPNCHDACGNADATARPYTLNGILPRSHAIGWRIAP